MIWAICTFAMLGASIVIGAIGVLVGIVVNRLTGRRGACDRIPRARTVRR